MNVIDWLVVAGACSLVFVVGLAFARRSSKKGAEGYFAGDRDVPWWAIGLSNTATYSSGTGAFVMLVLVFGLAGNWLWWTSWIVWMPLVAIVWARLWRRMQIVTTAELISLRYGGTPARAARKVYAFVCCFGFAVLIISYITGFFAKTIAPLCPMTTLQVLLIFGGITVVYTMFGGLLGVVYADVVQFGIMITGCTVFFVLAVSHHGGWQEILHRVREIRPAGLLQTPPSPSIGVLTLAVLFLQGWFFAGSPTAGEGMTAQRFMAAKNERHAVGGQLFNAFLALSFRTLPLIGLGIVAMSLFWTADPQAKLGDAPAGMTLLKDPAYAWGELIKHSHLPHGFIGLLVAAEVAAFMGSLSALINWGGSFVVNDLMPARFAKAQDKVWVSRLTTLGLFVFAAVVTYFFVNNMVSWFMFINSAMVIFLLPLAWFRFFWWRFNVWGELAAVILGLPLVHTGLVRAGLPEQAHVAGPGPALCPEFPRADGRDAPDSAGVEGNLEALLYALPPARILGPNPERSPAGHRHRTKPKADVVRLPAGNPGLPGAGAGHQCGLCRGLAPVRRQPRRLRRAGLLAAAAHPGG